MRKTNVSLPCWWAKLTQYLLSAPTAAVAAEKCYDEIAVAAHMECSGNGSRSADFTSGCKFVEAGIQKIEIECPPPSARWVNSRFSTAPMASHQSICESVGLKPTVIDGAVCASGYNQPRTGEGWQNIRYYWGPEKPEKVGGIRAKVIRKAKNDGGSDTNNGGYITRAYCYGTSGMSGEVEDMQEGWNYAVAYACGS